MRGPEVKGGKKGAEAIDGYDEYFSDRDVTAFDVTLAHIGDGEGIILTSRVHVDIHGRNLSLDWFDEEE
jgi:hypothetical protein